MNDSTGARRSTNINISERLCGHFRVTAEKPGEVTSTTGKSIIVEDEDGSETAYQLPRRVPLRAGGFVTHDIQAWGGDKVQSGDQLAKAREVSAGTPTAHLHVPWTGCGVAGDEMVFWQGEDGLCHYTPIRDVPSDKIVLVGALSSSSLNAKLSPVSSRIKHSSDEELVEVRTSEGTSVKILRAHGLLTMGDDGTLRKIRPGEIIEGETLIPRAQPDVPYGTGSNLLELETRTGKGKQLVLPLDREAGFFFGMYAAEGYTSGWGHKHVQIAASEKQLRKHADSVLNGWGLHTWSNEDLVATTSTALGTMLHEACGTGAENKQIPDILWRAPPEFRDGFISGYFSGDGTVNGGEISASTGSKKLAEGMVFLLGSVGVRASYRTYEKDGKEQYLDHHRIKVYQGGNENLPTLALTRKQKSAQKIKNSEMKFSRDRIPVPERFTTEVARAMRENNLSHSIYRTGYSSRPRLKKIYDDLPNRMQNLVDAPIWWERVESVEKIGSSEHAYDFEMGQRSNFMIGAGLLTRSTTQEAIEVSKSVSEKQG
ncbi:LAGLIDADG family homing endonuclease [Salinibacter ruber]|uniref:LAGLIDADG family homing endonuclease n=1 Tax=Salinibacter ruber TaxID=146919 RepID=UPI00216945B6|nr:LAGLIDADG family homing endonuclease [Salinibacter ruber]MCS3782691.1 intein/homing endonuclease [Salinibacter ruber]